MVNYLTKLILLAILICPLVFLILDAFNCCLHVIFKSTQLLVLVECEIFIYLLISFKAIMSDEGEKTCPLCAEEMDLTDQQLKPCKCGYEVVNHSVSYFV